MQELKAKFMRLVFASAKLYLMEFMTVHRGGLSTMTDLNMLASDYLSRLDDDEDNQQEYYGTERAIAQDFIFDFILFVDNIKREEEAINFLVMRGFHVKRWNDEKD